MGFACKELIADLNTIRFSTNPYNVNRMTSAAGVGAMRDEKYFKNNCAAIIKTRENTVKALNELGFSVLPSSANFVLAKSDKIGGEELYLALKREGILVRHFSTKRLCDFNRITIGSQEEMNALICAIKKVMEEEV
jgi:histidinol-phosphate aminotransferase